MAPAELVASLPETAPVMSGYGICRGQLSEDERTCHGSQAADAIDPFRAGIYPFIDYSTGESIDGMIAASEANLAAATDNTVIIPGHGKPVSNKSELKEFREMLVDVRDKVAALKKIRPNA